MSWGEPQQPNQPPEPNGPWGNPTGPEETQPYGAPPGPDGAYHSAPTQMYGSPPPPQPDYGAPTNPYGQPPQQPYGAPPPQYGAQPDPYGGYQPPTGPPKKKNNNLVIGLIVLAVLVVVGGGVAIATHKSSNPTPVAAQTTTPAPVVTSDAPTDTPTTDTPTDSDTGGGDSNDGDVSLPQSADGLNQLNTPVAQQTVTRVQSGLTSAGGDAAAVYQNALVGAYGPSTNGDPTTVLVVQPFTNLNSDDQSQFEDSSASDIVSGIMTGADATNVQNVTSSDSEAAISCGNVTSSGTSFYMCSWVDEDTFGVTYFYNKPDPAKAGQQTDALRNGADGD